MISDKKMLKTADEVIAKFEEWKNTVNSFGNQNAFTDRLLEEAFKNSQNFEQEYKSQFEANNNNFIP